MKSVSKFVSPVNDGKLAVSVSVSIKNLLKMYDGKKVSIAITEHKKKRSVNQNAFYWGVLLPAVRLWLYEQGINFDAEETHEFVVRHIWKHTELINLDENLYERRLSSKNLNTMEWEQYMDLTRQWAAEKGFELPFPNEYLFAG